MTSDDDQPNRFEQRHKVQPISGPSSWRHDSRLDYVWSGEGGAIFTVPVRDFYAGGRCEILYNPPQFFERMSGAAQPALTLSAFQAALQSEFQFEATAQLSVPLTLVEARARRSPTGEASGENFTLLFHGPAAQPLAQRMYPCTHPAFGLFDLFIVPVGRDQNSFHYEAVFNLQPQKK